MYVRKFRSRNCLACTLDYVAMQMRKTNSEKGHLTKYWNARDFDPKRLKVVKIYCSVPKVKGLSFYLAKICYTTGIYAILLGLFLTGKPPPPPCLPSFLPWTGCSRGMLVHRMVTCLLLPTFTPGWRKAQRIWVVLPKNWHSTATPART